MPPFNISKLRHISYEGDKAYTCVLMAYLCACTLATTAQIPGQSVPAPRTAIPGRQPLPLPANTSQRSCPCVHAPASRGHPADGSAAPGRLGRAVVGRAHPHLQDAQQLLHVDPLCVQKLFHHVPVGGGALMHTLLPAASRLTRATSRGAPTSRPLTVPGPQPPGLPTPRPQFQVPCPDPFQEKTLLHGTPQPPIRSGPA